MHVDTLMDAVVLKRANHLQTGPISHVGQSGVLMSSEVALENAAVCRAIEQRAPRLQLLDPVGRLLRVQLGHTPIVHVLAAPHGVGKVNLPVIPVVNICQCGSDAPLRHDGVRLPQE